MVSIIILSYNTADFISSCLQSVYTYVKDAPFEIIVVDNHSQDQSVHLIKTKFPKVRLIESKSNLGFAKGINLGVSYAKGEMLLFLNSDAQFFDTSFSKMVGFLREMKEKRVGIVGGKLINKDRTTSFSYHQFYTLSRVFNLLFYERGNRQESRHQLRVDWVSGGFMLIWKDLFKDFHGFDKGYFMYIEDMDLCYRISKKGFKTYFFPYSKVHHIGQGSSNRTFAIIQIYKGLLYFYKKHKPRWQYAILKGMLLTKAIVSIIVGIIKNDQYFLRTYMSAFKQIV